MRRATAPLLVRGGQPGAAVELAWCSAIYPGELQNTRRRPVRSLPIQVRVGAGLDGRWKRQSKTM